MTTEPSERAVTEPQVPVGKELDYSNLGIDAKQWGGFFCQLMRVQPEIATDEATMVGWFANAIMAGYDEAQRRGEDRIAAVTADQDQAQIEVNALRLQVHRRRIHEEYALTLEWRERGHEIAKLGRRIKRQKDANRALLAQMKAGQGLQPGSVANRICAYLVQRPDVSHRASDIAKAIGVDVEQVYGNLSRLVANKKIARKGYGSYSAQKGPK